MNIDHVFVDKLKINKIPDDHIKSIEKLLIKLSKSFNVTMKDNPKLSEYHIRHKLADNNMVYHIDEKGRLWIRRDALAKFCKKDEISILYTKMKQLTGWKWADDTSTTNPQAEISRWHNKVDELAEILLEVVKPVYE